MLSTCDVMECRVLCLLYMHEVNANIVMAVYFDLEEVLHCNTVFEFSLPLL